MYNTNVVGVNSLRQSLLSVFEEFMVPGQLRMVRSGVKVINEGDTDNNLYIVKRGLLKAGISRGENKINLDFLVAGDFFGISLENKSEFQSYFIETIEESEIYCCELYKLKELSGLVPEIDAVIRKMYSQWIKRLIDRFRSIAFLSSRERIIDLLKMSLSGDKFSRHNLIQRLSFKEMSDFCALPFNDFKRILMELESEGYFSIKSGVISEIKVNLL